MSAFSRAFWFLWVLCSCVGVACADVVVDTFGPGDSYLTSTLRVISGSSSLFGYNGVATVFTPGSTVALTSVEMAMRHVNGNNSYQISIAPDVAGQPGAALETWLVSPNSSPSIINLASNTGALLAAGSTYWLMAQPTANTQLGYWFVNDQGLDTGSVYGQGGNSGNPWASVANPDLAYRIQGAAAPEPGTLALLGVGAGGLMASRRKWRT